MTFKDLVEVKRYINDYNLTIKKVTQKHLGLFVKKYATLPA